MQLPLLSFSQRGQVTHFIETSVSANAYKGDLNRSYEKWTGAFHAGLQLYSKKRINGHLGLMVGTITGDNPDYSFLDNSGNSTPNTFFKTSVLGLNYDLQLNLIKKTCYRVYLVQGAGLLRFNPKSADNAPLTDKFSTRAKDENYNNITFFLPTGIGAMYIFKNGYAAGVQATFLNITSDYLDNISQWGSRKKTDNILSYKFSFYIPVRYKGKAVSAPSNTPKKCRTR